jgi:hypothetical protein
MVATASDTVDQAVMTTTGRCGSRAFTARHQLEPLVPGRGVARVVEVHEQQVERGAGLAHRGDHAAGDDTARTWQPCGLSSRRRRFEHVRLIVGHDDAWPVEVQPL